MHEGQLHKKMVPIKTHVAPKNVVLEPLAPEAYFLFGALSAAKQSHSQNTLPLISADEPTLLFYLFISFLSQPDL